MSAAEYPVALRLEGRLALVVGGGPVAERRVEGLLAAGARVRLVAPEAGERLRAWAEAGRCEWRRRPFRSEDLNGVAIAFAATGREEVNAEVEAAAHGAGLLCNRADRAVGDFSLPAVLRRGDLTVAVWTGGKSPSLASALRDRLAGELGEAWGTWVGILGDLRREARRLCPDPSRRGEILRRIAAEEGYVRRLEAGEDPEGLRRELGERLARWAESG